MQAKGVSDCQKVTPTSKVSKKSRAPVETVTIEGDENDSP